MDSSYRELGNVQNGTAKETRLNVSCCGSPKTSAGTGEVRQPADDDGIYLEWQRCLGGTKDDEASCVRQTADGGYIVAGYTESNNGDASGNHGRFDLWVTKLDKDGNQNSYPVWQKCLGGSMDEYAQDVQQTADGGYIVAGITNSNDGDVSGNHGAKDFWVVKLNAKGKIIWQKCLGGSRVDIAYGVEQTKDGGYIVAGFTESNNGDVKGKHGKAGSADFWVVKLNAKGEII
jgi:hypothetical protein